MSHPIPTVLAVVCMLDFAHFLADWTALSTPRMLAAKKFGTPLFPIFRHALEHTFLMWLGFFGIVLSGCPISMKGAALAAIIQLPSHFLIDATKGRIAFYWKVSRDPSRRPYWVIMGLDQFLHHAVILVMAWIVVGG